MKSDVVLTIDFGVLVMNEQRFCDAAYLGEIIVKAAKRGIRTILWRTLGGPSGLYRSRSVPTPADHNPKWKALLDAYDPLEAAVSSAHKHGMKIMAWSTLQDFHYVRFGIRGETGEPTVIKNTTPFFDKNPYLYWLSVDGKRFHAGIPCYGYQEARNYYLNHIKEVMGYGVDGFYVCFRSHALEPEQDDEFGYNEPWRKQLRDETGIDPPTAEIRDNGWLAYRMQKIRGASFTQLLREVRETVGGLPVWVGVAQEPDILVAGNSAKENTDRAFHRARLDVRGWCREGLVDTVIVVASRTNCGDLSIAELYRDATQAHGKKLYTWLNMIAQFWNNKEGRMKRTPSPDELRAIVASTDQNEVDGLVLHEAADLEFSYLRIYLDGTKTKWETKVEPQSDCDAQWDSLLG